MADYVTILAVPLSGMGLTWLSKLAALFDRVRFERLEFEYIPTASAMTSGTVIMAYDFDAAGTSHDTFAKINMMTPQRSSPVFKPMRLSVPPNRIMKQQWFPLEEDGTLGGLVYGVIGDAPTANKTMGQLYCNYTITLMGTRG